MNTRWLTEPNRLSASIMLTAFLLLGFILRIYRLDWSLPNGNHTQTYNTDEATTFNVLQNMDPGKLQFNPRYYDNPTLSFYVVGAGLKLASVFGLVKIVNSREYYMRNITEWRKMYYTGRFTNMLFDLGTVLLAFFIGKELFGRGIGMLSSLLTALNPGMVFQSHFLLVNTQFVFLYILSFYFLVRIYKTGNYRDYVLAGITAGLALSTKYSGVFVYISMLIILFFKLEKKDIAGVLKHFVNKKTITFLLISILVFFIGSPYMIFSGDAKSRTLGVGADSIFRIVFGNMNKDFIHDLIRPWNVLTDAVGLPVMLVVILSLIISIVRREIILLIIWSNLIVLYLICVRAGFVTLESRMTLIVPVILIGISHFIISNLTSKSMPLRLTAYCVTVAIISGTLFGLNVRVAGFSGADVREESSDWILSNVKSNEKIAILRMPLWWSPDVIYMKGYHNSGKGNFSLINVEFSKEALLETNAAYFVITDFEWEHVLVHQFGKIYANEFRSVLEQNYSLVKSFSKKRKILFFEYDYSKKSPYLTFTPRIDVYKKL